jgi:hypothetical protein
MLGLLDVRVENRADRLLEKLLVAAGVSSSERPAIAPKRW